MKARRVERQKSLQSQVFDYLMKAISTGRFPFGALLSEKVLAAELATSKTPVREAFVQLHSLGLVDMKPQRGWQVFQPTVKQIRELCEVRVVLEAAALRAAMAENKDKLIAALEKLLERASSGGDGRAVHKYQVLDEIFHLEFFRNCNNETLLSAYEIFRPRIHALRVNLQNQYPHLLPISSQDHTDIVERLRAGQVDSAIDTVSLHIRRMGDSYASHWEMLIRQSK